MADSGDKKEYLVRGAMLLCDKGSHPCRLNLPESHGVYIKENAMVSKEDGKSITNISYFGVCNSDTTPEGAETVYLKGYSTDGKSMPDAIGPKCCPDIIGVWRDVLRDGVTMDSYLVCSCGGIIKPKTSGQEYKDS